MRAPIVFQEASSRIARTVLLTAMLTVVAGTSHAQMHEGRGGGRACGGGGYGYGYGGGGHSYGRAHVYGGHGGGYVGRGYGYEGRRYSSGGARILIRGGDYRYCGAARYYSPFRYRRPHSDFGLGVNLGHLGFSYHSPAYGYDVRPAPVYVRPAPVYQESAPNPVTPEGAYDEHAQPAPEDRPELQVTNEPPAGCYYYDPSCDERFSNLDDYTEHLQHQRHSQMLSVVDKESGDTLRTLEFVDGDWQVRR